MIRSLHVAWIAALLAMVFPEASAAGEPAAVRGVIPVPASDIRTEGVYRLETPVRFEIRTPRGEAAAADDLGAYLATLGWQPAGRERADLELRLEPAARGFVSEEAYRLEITPRRIVATARATAGLFYAVQSLLQISDDGRPTEIACRTIDDAPRFAYRGFMIDVSRHFRSVEFIERQLDAMALFKLNRLHMHLTDGAGWRLEIERYPRLAEFAAWRPYADWESWWR